MEILFNLLRLFWVGVFLVLFVYGFGCGVVGFRV